MDSGQVGGAEEDGEVLSVNSADSIEVRGRGWETPHLIPCASTSARISEYSIDQRPSGY